MKTQNLKKIAATGMALLMTCTVCGNWGNSRQNASNLTITASAGAFASPSGMCGNNLTWLINTKGELYISGDGTIMDDYSYKCAPWFPFRKRIRSIVFSAQLEKIGSCAFEGCSNLKAAELPEQLQSMGHSVFKDCTSLESVTFPDHAITIPSGTFQSCTALKTVNIPKASCIERFAFLRCGLENVTIWGGCVMPFGFSECNDLASITFKGKVTLKSNAISDCPNLNNILGMDTSATYNWANDSFENCPELKKIKGRVLSRTPGNPPYFYNSNYDGFVKRYFTGSKNVGLVNQYVKEYCDYVIETRTTPNMTDLQKAKALHDWVIEKVDYDFDTPLNVKNTVASSIFLNNKTAYAGYAKGYAELMNAAGIETFYLESRYGMHRAAWNIVNLYGDYHHVDCAFDDYGTSSGANPALCKTPKYDGFLLLDEEIEQLGYHEKWNVLTRESHYEMSWYQADLETVHAMGEVCGVGCVTEQDADRIRAWLSGTATLSAAQRARADVDVDGRVSISDAILIEQFIATGERSFHPFFAEHLKPKK